MLILPGSLGSTGSITWFTNSFCRKIKDKKYIYKIVSAININTMFSLAGAFTLWALNVRVSSGQTVAASFIYLSLNVGLYKLFNSGDTTQCKLVSWIPHTL